MRTDRFMGLNEWSRELLKGCGRVHFTGRYETMTMDAIAWECEEDFEMEVPIFEPCVLKEESGSTYGGMFGDEYPLHKYTTRNGTMYYEYVQAHPWSSGPVFFLCLSIHKPDSPMAVKKFYTDEDCSDEEFFVPESLWGEEEITKA